jgi:hypothetical protein
MVNPAAGRVAAAQRHLHQPRSLAGIPRSRPRGLRVAAALLSSSSPRPGDQRQRPELEKTSSSSRFANGAKVKIGRRGRGASAPVLPYSRRGRREPKDRRWRPVLGKTLLEWSPGSLEQLGGYKCLHGSRNVDGVAWKCLLCRQLLTRVVAAAASIRGREGRG